MALKIAWVDIEVVFDPEGTTAEKAIIDEIENNGLIGGHVEERDLDHPNQIPFGWNSSIPYGTGDDRTVAEILGKAQVTVRKGE